MKRRTCNCCKSKTQTINAVNLKQSNRKCEEQRQVNMTFFEVLKLSPWKHHSFGMKSLQKGLYLTVQCHGLTFKIHVTLENQYLFYYILPRSCSIEPPFEATLKFITQIIVYIGATTVTNAGKLIQFQQNWAKKEPSLQHLLLLCIVSK